MGEVLRQGGQGVIKRIKGMAELIREEIMVTWPSR